MDTFWDMLPKVDSATGPTVVGLSPKVVQEEAVQEKEGVEKKSAKTSSVVSSTAATQSSEALEKQPTSRTRVKLLWSYRGKIVVAYAWVDEGALSRDRDILLETDPRRLRG
ncbi:hypothetical protein Dimus_010544 [Dionaea muscipula]